MNDPNLEIRLQRARSWIRLADALGSPSFEAKDEQTSSRTHMRFIFYWIGLNSMYGLSPIDPHNLDREPESQMAEISKFLTRVREIGSIDREEQKILNKAIQRCRIYGKALIEDTFLSKKYWKRDKIPAKITAQCKYDWLEAKEELDNGNFESFLHFSFLRLTVLRNQIIHSSATANEGSKGYESLKSGECFVQVMVPAILNLLECYGDRIAKWPIAPYPRTGHPSHPYSA